MKKSQLRQLIRKEIRESFVNENLSVDSDGNLIGIFNPPDTSKIKNSTAKITNWCEDMIESFPEKLEDDGTRGWKILQLPIKNISDVIIMHGNNIFKLPESEYEVTPNKGTNFTIKKYPDNGEVGILLWTKNQSLNIFNPGLLGNRYGKGIISLKYNGKLIGDDFSRDINYEYGKDNYIIEAKSIVKKRNKK